MKTAAKIYVTHEENQRFFGGKLSTWRNNFTRINRQITITEDPTGVYESGELGYIMVAGKQLFVTTTDSQEWEVKSLQPNFAKS